MLTAVGEEVLPGCIYSVRVREVARLGCWCGPSARLTAATHAVGLMQICQGRTAGQETWLAQCVSLSPEGLP